MGKSHSALGPQAYRHEDRTKKIARANRDVRPDCASGRIMSVERSIVVQLGRLRAGNVGGVVTVRRRRYSQAYVNSTRGLSVRRSGSSSHNHRRAPRSWRLIGHSSARASMILEWAMPVTGLHDT